jgi:Glycosyltransferase
MQDYGLLPERVCVVYYGIEPERWISPTKDLRSEWGFFRKPVVGTIGRLEPRKGHDILIQAMPSIVQQFPQTILLIAGHDPWGYRQVLERMVAQLGMNDHVHFLGFQDDVLSFMHAIDVFAFASRSEGFGQVVIEAMAAGKPVVVSRIAPLTEIVVDGKTASGQSRRALSPLPKKSSGSFPTQRRPRRWDSEEKSVSAPSSRLHGWQRRLCEYTRQCSAALLIYEFTKVASQIARKDNSDACK